MRLVSKLMLCAVLAGCGEDGSSGQNDDCSSALPCVDPTSGSATESATDQGAQLDEGDVPSFSERRARPPRRDAGTPVIDSGAPVRDAGTVVVDSGVRDAGSVPATSTGQWVLGYYVGYQVAAYPLASIDWSGLTHIALAPLTVKTDRTFDTTFFGFGDNAAGKSFAKQLSSAAHARGVKALLMLGGAGISDPIKTWLSADKNGFVNALIALTNELGFDGIDLDVEASNFSLDDYISLASALRAAAPKLLLAVPGASIQLNQQVDARIVKLATYLDRYNIQSYQGGSHGLFTGGNSAGQRFESWFYSSLGGVSALRPYSIDHALSRLAAAGIPKAKLGMGVAFYAGCYKIPNTTVPGGVDVSAPRISTNAPSDWCWDCGIGGGDNTYSLSKFFSANSVFGRSTTSEQKFDTVAQEPYLSFATPRQDSMCGGNTRYVIYEDERSLIAKGAFSRGNGYGGIIVWTIQQGYLPEGAAGGRARNALMQALRKGFIAP